MRQRARWSVLVLALVLTVSLAGAAQGASPKQKWSSLTLVQRQAVAKKEVARYRSTVRWWINRRALIGLGVAVPPGRMFREPLSAAARMAWCPAIGVRSPVEVCGAALKMRHAMAVLAVIEAKLAMPADCQGGASREACAWYFDGATQCETSYEGGWASLSSGGTYAGRFQMDSSFEVATPFGAAMQASYGRANNWPSWAQIQHAYEEWLSRGWGPWPPYYKFGCSAWHGRGYRSTTAPFGAV